MLIDVGKKEPFSCLKKSHDADTGKEDSNSCRISSLIYHNKNIVDMLMLLLTT